MKTKVLTALLLLNLAAKAQTATSSVINAAGNSFSQGYYAIDWSVGELAVVNTMSSPNGYIVLTNGLLQPAGSNENINPGKHFTSDEIKILPNPTFNRVEINISTLQQGTLNIIIYDAAGKQLMTTKTISNGLQRSEKMDLSAFASGTYLFYIELNPLPGSIRKTGTFKIVKL